MPFETYSNELNLALGGGFDGRLNLILGDRRTGKTTLALDIVERYVQRPDSKTVVILTPHLTAWTDEIKAWQHLRDKVQLVNSLERTRGMQPDLVIAEVEPGPGSTYTLGSSPFSLNAVRATSVANTVLLISPRLAANARQFDHVVQMSESDGTYTLTVIKNRNGPQGVSFDVTRREIRTTRRDVGRIEDLKDVPTALGDEFDSVE